ncbi:MAG: M1 family metallopeptidase [Acidobacteria bacterium]|nr:M1 family metallopeptidase [Acidobacteriota bacterium]
MKTLRRTFAFVCLATILGLGSSAASGLAQSSAAINAPMLGYEITLTRPVRMGHVEMKFSTGTKAHALIADGRVCGMLIEGDGWLKYTIDNTFSIPVAKRNITRCSHLHHAMIDGALQAGEAITGAVIWGWNVVPTKPKAGIHAGSQGLPAWATSIVTKPLFSPPSDLLLAEKRLGAHGTFYAVVAGAKNNLLIAADPLDKRCEFLYRIRKVKRTASLYHGRFYLEELAAQPLGRRWIDRFPAPLVATHQSIDIDNDHGPHVIVRTTSTLVATRPSVGLWVVALVSDHSDATNLYPIRVTSVTVDGRPADFLHHSGELLVALDPPVMQGRTVTVSVVNEGNLATPPGHDNYWWLGTWPWYPQPPLNGEFATVDMSVRTPSPFIPFASGAIVAKGIKDGYAFVRTRLDRPSQLPVAAAGKYHVYSKTRNGITCNVASYVFGKKKACRRLIKDFFAASSFYGKLFDAPWPYPDVQVIEINTWGFGQAPPGVIFITKEAYQPLIDTFNQFFSAGVNERYVHEIAHTWWGHRLMMDSLDEQWLTESFAEYSAAMFLQAAHGGGRAGAKVFKQILDGWRAHTKEIGPGGSIFLANHLAGEGMRDYQDRIYLLYAKGPLVLHAIRLRLRKIAGSTKKGDAMFITLLRSFLKNTDFKWGSTRTLIGILDQMTGQNWQPFFDRYVFGTETPHV